ncbi:MAG: gamma-glutamyl-gamma-aminobutyrate hydrolase family protein [Solirubrobacteraceae bacterium]
MGIQRPLLSAGALPVTLAQLPEALPDMLEPPAGVVLAPDATSTRVAPGRRPTRCWRRPSPAATSPNSRSWAAALECGLRATATAPDGVVEAIELEGSPVLGVQWELQEECRIDARFAAVFEWFVAGAEAYAQLRGRFFSVS